MIDQPDTLSQMVRMLAALAFVVALMGGLALVMKKYASPGARAVSTGKKRLKILEILVLDGRRRAVLLRRDDREHLVILGPNGETVVESGILSKDKDEAA